MSNLVRSPKDFWSGVIFTAFGLCAVLVARDYAMGSPGRMGPAYFPTVLGGMLALIGVVCMARAMVRAGDAVQRFAVKEVALILSATVLFGVLVRNAGLAPAIIVLVMMSGYASKRFRVSSYLALAMFLAVFAALVFVKGLGLPMPIFGPWLGF